MRDTWFGLTDIIEIILNAYYKKLINSKDFFFPTLFGEGKELE